MDWGSDKLFVDTYAETEEIYADEVNDGIASCAEEQAAVWSLESASVPGLARAAAAPGWQYSHAEV